MKVLVASRNSLHTTAISGILSTEAYSPIQTTAWCDGTIKNSETLPFDAFILCHSLQQEVFIDWIDHLREASPIAPVIAIVPDLCSIKLAGLIARRVAILHVVDASKYLIEALLHHNGAFLREDDHLEMAFLSPQIMELVGLVPSEGDTLYELTNTELQIASFLLQGYNNKRISDLLFRSPQTIESHRKHIKDKLALTGGKNALITHLIPYTLWVLSAAGGASKNPRF